MNETTKVKIEGLDREIEIKKLPLGKFAELLKALKNLPLQLESIINLSQDQLLSKLPEMISESFPDFIEIIKIGANLTEGEVQTLSVDEAIDCIIAIFTINKFAYIWEKLKKGFAPLQKIQGAGSKTSSVPNPGSQAQ